MTISRRDFILTSSSCLVAGTLARPLLARPLPPRPRPARGPALGAEFRELRRGVGVFTGRGGTIGWLANHDGAVAVDSQFPDTARTALVGLRDRGAVRLDALINTHHHRDHTAGNGVLGEAADRIVAHRQVPQLQRAAAGAGDATAQTYADTTFERQWSLDVGDETVRARHYEPAHTAGDATVYFERADVVHTGDLVFNAAYPFIDRDAGASIQGWIATLEAVAAEYGPGTIFIFGHGAPSAGITGDRVDLLAQRDFLSAVLDTAMGDIDADWSREETMDREELPGFEHYTAISSSLTLATTLGAAYDELTTTPPVLK